MTSPRTGSVGLTSMSKNSGGVPTAIGQIASSKVYNPLGYIWDREIQALNEYILHSYQRQLFQRNHREYLLFDNS